MADKMVPTWARLAGMPIVVGVDDSRNSADAAAFARTLARRIGVSCHLIHVVQPGYDPVAAGLRVQKALGMTWLQLGVDELEVHVGHPAEVLCERARVLHAGLVIVGGKQHSLLGRWVAGSTAVGVVRASPVPVLVAHGAVGTIQRVIVGADASSASFGAILAAEAWADLWSAELRVTHALPLPPVLPEFSAGYELDLLRTDGEARANELIWPLIGRKGTERRVELGEPSMVLTEQAREWQAQLLVVARHDRGWAERVLMGSVTERLLDGMPTSILVVPATPVELHHMERSGRAHQAAL